MNKTCGECRERENRQGRAIESPLDFDLRYGELVNIPESPVQGRRWPSEVAILVDSKVQQTLAQIVLPSESVEVEWR